MERRYNEAKFVICHNGSDIIHPVEIEANTVLISMQPEIEEFDSREEWETRLNEMGFDVERLKASVVEEFPKPRKRRSSKAKEG